MASNHVDYKLCDKEFDCDNCEFDKAIRNLSDQDNLDGYEEIKHKDILIDTISKIENESYDEKIIYLNDQLIIKKLFGPTYYLGLNPLLSPLFDDLNSIEGFEKDIVSKDQLLFKIKGNWGEKNFYSPMNLILVEKLDFNRGQLPMNNKLAVILINDFEDSINSIKADDWNIKKNKSLHLLKSYAHENPDIGKSLLDGGERIKYLHQYLGAAKFLKLLDEVFK
jgi:hypothetical protein